MVDYKSTTGIDNFKTGMKIVRSRVLSPVSTYVSGYCLLSAPDQRHEHHGIDG
jgi:hypothetical protein